MNPTEALTLTRYARAAFPQQKFDEYTPDVWAKAVADLALADCQQAVDELVKRQSFVSVADIRAEVRRIRDDRIRAAGNAEPEYDRDDVAAGLDAIRRQRQALADGRLEPLPALPAAVPDDLRKMADDTAAAMRRRALRPSRGYVEASRKLATARRAEVARLRGALQAAEARIDSAMTLGGTA